MRKKTVNRILIAILMCSAVADWGLGSITGSAHDFSSQPWGDGQICKPCHTPHNSDIAVTSGPLWNHEMTAASFTLYSSPTLKGTVQIPQGPTKLCLSCHDGTVGLDSFGGESGILFVSSSGLIGTNLSNDHPVSIKWEHKNDFGENQICSNCHNLHTETLIDSQLPFPDGFVECSTCHDVHGTSYPNLLRLSNQRSQLCLYCHGK